MWPVIPSPCADVSFTKFSLKTQSSTSHSILLALTHHGLSSPAPHGCSFRVAPFLPGPLKLTLTDLLPSVSLCSSHLPYCCCLCSAHITFTQTPDLLGGCRGLLLFLPYVTAGVCLAYRDFPLPLLSLEGSSHLVW